VADFVKVSRYILLPTASYTYGTHCILAATRRNYRYFIFWQSPGAIIGT